MAEVVLAGQNFRVVAVSGLINDRESYEFVSTDPQRLPPLRAVVSYRKHDPARTLYVNVRDEIELPVLEQMIAHVKEEIRVE